MSFNPERIPSDMLKLLSRFDIFTQAAAKLPEYARSQNYQNPTESTNSAFVYATGSEFWTYLKKTPTQSQIFNDFMATRRQGRPNWYDTYPIEQELSSPPNVIGNGHGESNILLVDVGGNRGHDLINLRNKHPGLQGRMILQDLPDVIAHTFFDQEDGIEAVPHDFFQRQPIQRMLLSLAELFVVLFPPATQTANSDQSSTQQMLGPTTSVPSSMTGPTAPAARSSSTPPRP